MPELTPGEKKLAERKKRQAEHRKYVPEPEFVRGEAKATTSKCDDVAPLDGGTAHLELSPSLGGCGEEDESLFENAFFSIPLPDGGACVSDYSNHRLCIFAADGSPPVHIGERGRDLGTFTRPLGIALTPDGELLVADDADRVQRFDDEGNAVDYFGDPRRAAAADEFFDPIRCEVREGHRKEPLKFLQPGELPPRPNMIQPGQFSRPNNPSGEDAPDPNDLPHYWNERTILDRLWAEGGQEAVDRYMNPTYLRMPYGVATGPNGRIYVSDKGHDRIACFDRDGRFAFSFGRRGSKEGQLRDPRGLCVHKGRVYVADFHNNRIAVFSLRGRHLKHIGRFGDGPGEMRHPSGVAISQDLLLVSEWDGGRVQVLSLVDGTFLHSIRAPFKGAAVGAIAADEQGHVTVTDSYDRLHCLALTRWGDQSLPMPAEDDELEPGGPLELVASIDRKHKERVRRNELMRTRAGASTARARSKGLQGRPRRAHAG